MNPLHLLRTRRFLPFFGTQFLGAFNDNVYKYAVMLILGFGASSFGLPSQLSGNDLIQICGALFILPFLLFSATSGQLADKYEKTQIIRWVKRLEVLIMLIGAWGLIGQHLLLLLLAILLLGFHSTLFGPIKYAILPQHLRENELLQGNGLVEMGTFVAILLGEVLGGWLIGLKPSGPYWVGAVSVVVALLGLFCSTKIPEAPATAPDLVVDWNPIRESWRNLGLIRRQPRLHFALLGASWFWFVGAILLQQFPNLTKDILHGDEHVATVLLAIFSISVGVGSVLCDKVSNHQVKLSLVPQAALGLAVSGLVFAWALPAQVPGLPEVGVQQFFQHAPWLAMIALASLGFFGGMFVVPLYAMMQSDTEPAFRARMIANNNILNAVFLIVASLFAMVALKFTHIQGLLYLCFGLHLLATIIMAWAVKKLEG